MEIIGHAKDNPHPLIEKKKRRLLFLLFVIILTIFLLSLKQVTTKKEGGWSYGETVIFDSWFNYKRRFLHWKYYYFLLDSVAWLCKIWYIGWSCLFLLTVFVPNLYAVPNDC